MHRVLIMLLVAGCLGGCQQSIEISPTETPPPSAPTPVPPTETQAPASTATEMATLSLDDPDRWAASATMRYATVLARHTDTIATQRAWGTETAIAPTRTVPPTQAVNTGPFEPLAPTPLEGVEFTGELIVTADGQLWLATLDEIAVWQHGEWLVYASFAAQDSMFAGIDDGGRIWAVALDLSWIAVWDGAHWVRYEANAGWSALHGWQRDTGRVHSDRAGRLWIATTEDLRTFDGDRWTLIAPEVMGFPAIEIRDDLWSRFTLNIQPDGAVWVGHCYFGGPGPFGGHGARWMDQFGWHGSDSPVNSGCVQAITSDTQGRILLGLEHDLWRYDPASETWEQFPFVSPDERLRRGHIVDITVGPDGTTWLLIVFCGGASCGEPLVLYRLDDNEQWHWMAETNEWYFGQEIIYTNGIPRVFFEGIHRVDGEQLQLEANVRGWSPVVDHAGQLWFIGMWQGESWLWTEQDG